jgi:hypothetical protein
MSWQGTDWKYDPDISEIAIPINITDSYVFNIEDVYTVFHSGDVTTMYLCAPVMNIPVLGAFAYTTDITSIEIPISVKSIGDFSFYGSSLQTAKISPFLNYTDGTFPQSTSIIYWNVTDLSCVLTKTEYNVGDSFDYSTCTVTVTVYDGTEYETGVVENYEVVDFDTSQEGEIPLKIKYNGTVYNTGETITITNEGVKIVDLTNSNNWSVKNFIYPSSFVITCDDIVQVPKNAISVEILTTLTNRSASDSCYEFFKTKQEEENYLNNNTAPDPQDYADGWQGTYNSISDVTSHKIQLSGTTRKSFVTMIAFKPIASNIPITRSNLISCKIKFELDTNYKIVDLTNEAYQNNNISEYTGQTVESTTWRICNSNYIEIPDSRYKYIMIESALQNDDILNSEIFFYDANNNYLGYKFWYPTTSDIVYAPIPEGAVYFRLLLGSFVGGDFTSANLGNVTATFAISANDILITRYGWTQNTGNDDTGEMNLPSSTRICCQNYIPIPTSATKVSVSASTSSNVPCDNFGYWYTDSTYIVDWWWVSSGTQVNIDSNATRLRIGLRRNDSANITPSDLLYCIVRFT